MLEHPEFTQFVHQIRLGDGQAAEELIRRYESAIRVAVRTKMTDPSLKRELESMDICQSVFASFFLRAAAGQYDLSNQKNLVGLLVRMAQNKLAMQVRKQHQQCRDTRKNQEFEAGPIDHAGRDATPSRIVAGQEMWGKVQAQLSQEERDIVSRRASGEGWEQIATAMGGTPDGRRKQIKRALDRVSEELGLGIQDAEDFVES